MILLFVFGVPSVSTRDAEGLGDHGSGLFIAEDIDGVGVCILDCPSVRISSSRLKEFYCV